MAKFSYQAKANTGKIQSGEVEATSIADAGQKLRLQGLVPMKVTKLGGSFDININFNTIFPQKVPSKELQIFTRQFSTLINSGITVADALKMLSEGKRNPVLKEASFKVKNAIESGKRLADALAANPNVFDKFYVNMVRAGEEGGILDGILMRLALYLEKSEKIKKQVKGAMVYPAAIILVAMLVITGILVFIIPKFQEMYASAGRDLPFVTQMVVNLSQFLISKWYVAIGGVIAIPYIFMSWYGTTEGKEFCDRVFISAPVFGDLIQKSAVAKMTRTLSTLLGSGVGVIEALEIAAKTAGNKVIEDALVRSKESVTSGKALATPLLKEKAIPDMVTQMIAIGEQSGSLDSMLSKIADFYEDDVENAVKAMTSLIEPLLMVFLGTIIATLVVAMYLPIFDMANVVGK